MGVEKTEMLLDFLDPSVIELSIDAFNKLHYKNMATGEELHDVEIKLMFPLSQNNRYLAINQGSKEIGFIRDYKQLNSSSRQVVTDILDMHYFIPEIVRVIKVKEEYRMIHWMVETNRGELDFYTRTRNDIVVKGNRVYIRDIDGNRYLIKDHTKLSLQSQKELSSEI